VNIRKFDQGLDLRQQEYLTVTLAWRSGCLDRYGLLRERAEARDELHLLDTLWPAGE